MYDRITYFAKQATRTFCSGDFNHLLCAIQVETNCMHPANKGRDSKLITLW